MSHLLALQLNGYAERDATGAGTGAGTASHDNSALIFTWNFRVFGTRLYENVKTFEKNDLSHCHD